MAVTPILLIPLTAPTQLDKTTTGNDAVLAIENATQAQLTVSFAAGDVTLTTTQFVGAATFVCTEAAAAQTLLIPIQLRQFIVDNSAGSYGITVKPSSGSGTEVVVAPGAILPISCDGTNIKTTSAPSSTPAAVGPGDFLVNLGTVSAAPAGHSLTQALDAIFGAVEGGIVQRGPTAWEVLSPGTLGEVLTAGTALAAWAAPAGGGGGGGGGGEWTAGTVTAVGNGLTFSGSTLNATLPVYDTAVAMPALSTFTQINGGGVGGCTIAQATLSKVTEVTFSGPAADSKLHGISIAAPAAPYRIAVMAALNSADGSGPAACFGWSDGTKYQCLARYGNAGTGSFIFNFSDAQTLLGVTAGPFNATSVWGGIFWVGLRNDGTNLFYEFSNDGVNFITINEELLSTDYLSAATDVFVGLYANASSNAALSFYVYDVNGLTRAFA